MREILRIFCLLLCVVIAWPAVAGVSGVVTESGTDEPLIGVNVFLKQDSLIDPKDIYGDGTVTDLDGNFTIDKLPDNAKFIQFSYVGYKTIILPLVDGKEYNISLDEDGNELENVVVVKNMLGETCASDLLNKLSAETGVYDKKDERFYCSIQTCKQNYTKQNQQHTVTYVKDGEEITNTQYEKCACLAPFAEVCNAENDCACNKEEKESEEKEEVPEPEEKEEKNLVVPRADKDSDRQTPTDEEIKELRAKADAAHERETSMANKMLGAAGIGATGVGGMMLMQGMAEKSADGDAEQQMRAYLATFNCQYGDGRAQGGETDVELPGANALIPLYSEYVTLANSVKSMKSELGLKPGIESESILDSATSGLYDDVSVGKTSGAFTSLARALMDPDGPDAKAWAQETEKTSQNIKTGAITAGAGAGVGLVGHITESAVYKNKSEKNK